jgi:hypothetical protein
MKKNHDNWGLVDLALIFGAIFLASKNTDGWGWLIFILFLRHN